MSFGLDTHKDYLPHSLYQTCYIISHLVSDPGLQTPKANGYSFIYFV